MHEDSNADLKIMFLILFVLKQAPKQRDWGKHAQDVTFICLIAKTLIAFSSVVNIFFVENTHIFASLF